METTISKGSSHLSGDDTFRGAVSKKIFLGLVDFQAVAGHVKHLHITQIVTYINSEAILSKPLQLSPATGNYRDGYISLLKTTGILFKGASLLFSSADWPLGYSFFGFNLEPNVGDASCVNFTRKVVLGISCTFAIPTTATYSVVIYYNLNAMTEIYARRNICCPYRRM